MSRTRAASSTNSLSTCIWTRARDAIADSRPRSMCHSLPRHAWPPYVPANEHKAFLRGCTAGATRRGGTLPNSLLRRSAPRIADLDRRRAAAGAARSVYRLLPTTSGRSCGLPGNPCSKTRAGRGTTPETVDGSVSVSGGWKRTVASAVQC
jgi:hypothetical protein